MIRPLLLFFLLFQTNCGGMTAFVTSAAGNIVADYAGKKINPDNCIRKKND